MGAGFLHSCLHRCSEFNKRSVELFSGFTGTSKAVTFALNPYFKLTKIDLLRAALRKKIPALACFQPQYPTILIQKIWTATYATGKKSDQIKSVDHLQLSEE